MRLQVNLPIRQANRCIIALGSNGSERQAENVKILSKSIKLLQKMGVDVQKTSSLYSTPAFPQGKDPDFVNAALRCSFDGNQSGLLELLHRVEAECGRVRHNRWGQRTLDLDLIFAGNLVEPSLEYYARWRDLPLEQQMQQTPDQLILPHPRVQDRGFVLVPVHDVAPDWVHPVSGLTVAQMLDEIPAKTRAEIVAIP